MRAFLRRRNVIIVSLLVLGMFAYVASGPYRTISAINSAFETENDDLLAACVDKDRFQKSVYKMVTPVLGDNGELDDTAKFVVDSLHVTGFLIKLWVNLKSENYQGRWNSMGSYSVSVFDDEDCGHTYFFERYGLHWKLCRIAEWHL